MEAPPLLSGRPFGTGYQGRLSSPPRACSLGAKPRDLQFNLSGAINLSSRPEKSWACVRPTQGDENRLKGTAFRPSVTITITVATEGNIFDRAKRSGATVCSLGPACDAKGSATLPFVIPSISTCLRQVEGEMNSVHEVVIIAFTPNGSATFTSRVQSRRDDLKVAQDVSPGNTP